MSHDVETVAALAVGTSKVAALVAERDERGGTRVIGVGVHSTAGIRKGEVTSVEGVTGSVEKAVAAAEKVCNRPIRSVFLGVGGASLTAQGGRAVIPVSRPSAGISSRDMERALSAARMTAVPPDLPRVRSIAASPKNPCAACGLRTVCGNCPAWSALETGSAESAPDFRCQVARERCSLLGKGGKGSHGSAPEKAPVSPA